MRIAIWATAGVFLAVSAYSDLRRREISLRICLLTVMAGVIFRLLAGSSITVCVSELCAGVIPGVLLMGLAIGSGEQIGKGDAWVLAVLGTLTGAEAAVRIFITALVVAALCALGRRICCCAERGEEAAFAADLLLAYLLRLFAEGRYAG